ncbi:hypothetical protein BF49_5590 [Bradyrhizobium sp.]|uniref:hypothetical protein n=1 Tax=Bradyrhizobium sp. TaxID=376 RepID=UPI0007C1E4FB|nr:hypothetical protein BF49_5590 [Bradyrhizobium sp.]
MAGLGVNLLELFLEHAVQHQQRPHGRHWIASARLDGLADGSLQLYSFVDGGCCSAGAVIQGFLLRGSIGVVLYSFSHQLLVLNWDWTPLFADDLMSD